MRSLLADFCLLLRNADETRFPCRAGRALSGSVLVGAR